MDLAEVYSLIEIFREKAAEKRWEERQEIVLRDQFEDRRKRHEKEVREKEEREQLEKLILASAEQIEAFTQRLDTYDTATVHALMDNDIALDAARHTREVLEVGAYRTPDGRIAIKSDDGKRVLDRHGVELPPATIEPGAIPDALPRWTAFKAADDAEQKLMRERHDILVFQERLDAARETVGKDHVSAKALSDMDADLRRAMPDAVKAKLPDAGVDRTAPAIQREVATAAYRPPAGPALVIGAP